MKTSIVGETDTEVIAEATVWDMQFNNVISIQERRTILTREGKRYSRDMIVVTGKAAQSIALRNAIFRIVPRPIVEELYQHVINSLGTDEESLKERRNECFKVFKKIGVSKSQILKKLKIKNEDQMSAEHLESMIGIYNAIRDGETTAEAVFKDAADRIEEVLNDKA